MVVPVSEIWGFVLAGALGTALLLLLASALIKVRVDHTPDAT